MEKQLHRGVLRTPREIIEWCVEQIKLDPSILDEDNREEYLIKKREYSKRYREKEMAKDPTAFRKRLAEYAKSSRKKKG